MNSFYLRSLALLVVSSVGMSCYDFLEETPGNDLVTTAFFTSDGDVRAAVNGVYGQLQSSRIYDFTVSMLTGVESDESQKGTFGGSDISEIDQGAFNSGGAPYLDWWQGNYAGINGANLVLKYGPNVPFRDRVVGGRLLAEAKFLRALFYFNLTLAYGDVPLLLEPTEGNDLPPVTRTPIAAVHAQIEKDLREAIAGLPFTYTGNDVGRATKGAARAMLAKLYLHQKNYAACRAHTDTIINNLGGSYGYDLIADYARLLTPADKNRNEHIFSVQFSFVSQAGSSNPINYGPNTGPNPNMLLVPGLLGQSSFAAEDSMYRYFPNTYRKNVTFFGFRADTSRTSGYTVPRIGGGTTQLNIVHCVKYFDATRTSQGQAGSTNYNVIRFADVLLMAAEAANELDGPTATAVGWVNRIRKRARTNAAGVDAPASYPDLVTSQLTKDSFRRAILDERRWELCFEGHRRWDLIRTGQYLTAMRAAGKVREARHLLFPIPQREILLNPQLTQNPGW